MTRFRVIIQPQAAVDIQSAQLYLMRRSIPAATRWFNGLYDAILSLESMPNSHGLAIESKDLGIELRQLLYGRRQHKYRILYVVRGDEVIVLRVRHGAQRPLHPDEIE